MIKKTKAMELEISTALRKLLQLKISKVYLPDNFGIICVKCEDDKHFASYPHYYTEFGINPLDYGSDEKTFFLVIECFCRELH